MRCELDRAAVLPAVGLRGLAPQDAARSYRDVLVRAPQDNGGQHSQRRTRPLARNRMALATPSEGGPQPNECPRRFGLWPNNGLRQRKVCAHPQQLPFAPGMAVVGFRAHHPQPLRVVVHPHTTKTTGGSDERQGSQPDHRGGA